MIVSYLFCSINSVLSSLTSPSFTMTSWGSSDPTPAPPDSIYLYAHALHGKKYLLCTSRGTSRNGTRKVLGINEEMVKSNLLRRTGIEEYHRSGRKLEQLIDKLEEMHSANGRPVHSSAYFLAGYCDITNFDLDENYAIRNSVTGYYWRGRYEEATFLDNVEEAVAKATARYQEADRRVRHLGIRPCFATVPPSVLADWNQYRLSCGRTAFLLHESQYHDMQSLLNRACQAINGVIISINKANGMATPFIAGTIMDTKSNKHGIKLEPRIYKNKYFDGVHATDDTMKEWAKVMARAININDNIPITTTQLPSLFRDRPVESEPDSDIDSDNSIF